MPFDTEVAEDTLDVFPSEYECFSRTYAALEIKGPAKRAFRRSDWITAKVTHIRSI